MADWELIDNYRPLGATAAWHQARRRPGTTSASISTAFRPLCRYYAPGQARPGLPPGASPSRAFPREVPDRRGRPAGKRLKNWVGRLLPLLGSGCKSAQSRSWVHCPAPELLRQRVARSAGTPPDSVLCVGPSLERCSTLPDGCEGHLSRPPRTLVCVRALCFAT